LELGLGALTGRLAGVVVADARTLAGRHLIELETVAGPLLMIARG
jgi:hypothetical protein